MLLPIGIESKDHPGSYQNERLADMWQYEFWKYDVICLQEVWGVFADELKDVCILYAQKSGFFYHAKSQNPTFHSLYYADSGLLILSRYPITKSAFRIFSLGYKLDAEATRGVLFAQVSVFGLPFHFYTCHT
jgi:endonuclease/exonuclease/phosphatase family metal-dependent hydrolase